jgi:hypothetical protein
MDNNVEGVPLPLVKKGVALTKAMEVYGFALWIASFVCFGKDYCEVLFFSF